MHFLSKTNSIQDELESSLCLWMWCEHLHIHVSHVDNCNIKIEADHVCDYVTDNALKREKLYLVLFSCKILFQRLVVFNMTLFKGRYSKLSIHIFIISVRQVFAEIEVVLFWKIIETAMAESAPCLFSLFYKSTFFVIIMKSRPFTVSNNTLFLSVRSKMADYF